MSSLLFPATPLDGRAVSVLYSPDHLIFLFSLHLIFLLFLCHSLLAHASIFCVLLSPCKLFIVLIVIALVNVVVGICASDAVTATATVTGTSRRGDKYNRRRCLLFIVPELITITAPATLPPLLATEHDGR